ncbi:hypothetical protein BT69DRAFT_1304674 [Atractiella rhizophila]|nr:hypothetical protein BT69DRAFT_1304674 [Atractiella rhizophila]
MAENYFGSGVAKEVFSNLWSQRLGMPDSPENLPLFERACSALPADVKSEGFFSTHKFFPSLDTWVPDSTIPVPGPPLPPSSNRSPHTSLSANSSQTKATTTPSASAPRPQDPSSDADTDPLIPPRDKGKSKAPLSREVSPDLEVLNVAPPPMGQRSIGDLVKSYFASHPDLPMILGLPRLEDPRNLTSTHKFFNTLRSASEFIDSSEDREHWIRQCNGLPPSKTLDLIVLLQDRYFSCLILTRDYVSHIGKCEIELAKAVSAAKEKDDSLEAALTRIASLESELQALRQISSSSSHPPVASSASSFLPSISAHPAPPITSGSNSIPIQKKRVLFDLDDLPSIDECKRRRISGPIENTSTASTQCGDTTKSRKDLVKDAWSSKRDQTLDIDPNMNPSLFLESVAPRVEEWIQHHPHAYVPLNIFAESTKRKVEAEFNESKGSLNSENQAVRDTAFRQQGLSIFRKYEADALLTSKADWDFGFEVYCHILLEGEQLEMAQGIKPNGVLAQMQCLQHWMHAKYNRSRIACPELGGQWPILLKVERRVRKIHEQCHRAHFGSEDNWEIMFNDARMEVSDLVQLKSSLPIGNTSFSLGTSNTLLSQSFRQPFRAQTPGNSPSQRSTSSFQQPIHCYRCNRLGHSIDRFAASVSSRW